MRMNSAALILLPAFVLVCSPAYAYIGPGAGAGAITVVLGIIASVFMAFFAILWYPIKRVLKKRKPTQLETKEAKSEAVTGSSNS